MSKQKYYQVDTKKVVTVEAKCGRGRSRDITIPNALQQANEECESYYILHPSHKWIDKFKEADKKKRKIK